MGKIDMLVHNAGYGDDCFLKDITEEFYTTQSDINLKGGELPQDGPS
jgi:3-oxoacyl-[acyl-carrier protein] reductase